MEHVLGQDRAAARFEDAFADGGGANDALVAFGVLADKVRDGVEPLGVPGEDSRPHLVALVGSYFAFEATLDPAQLDGETALAQVDDAIAVLVPGLVDAEGEEGAKQVGSGDVKVGVVSAVGLCFSGYTMG